MIFSFLCFFLFFYFIYISSFHSLILLMVVEFVVLFCFFFLVYLGVDYFSCLFFILVAVCLGAYGVSLLVSSSRSKSSFYFLGVDIF